LKILIAGKQGQLARAFIKRLQQDSIDFLAPDEDVFEITDSNKIMSVVDSYRPEVIINCAAYNLVEQAEQDYGNAFKVNGLGPKLLAWAAQKYNAKLVHFGSDYIFDGQKEDGLYSEEDQTQPLNQYGRSKLMGERWVQEETDNYLIFRLSWVFGEGKQNFIYKLFTWAQNNRFLKISCDEFSVPTYTETVVEVVLKALDQNLTGLYHLTNQGFCSRYQWALQVMATLEIPKFIRPVSITSFNLPVKRPLFSAMSNKAIALQLNIDIPSWEEAVEQYLKNSTQFNKR